MRNMHSDQGNAIKEKKRFSIISFGYLNATGSGGGFISWHLANAFMKNGLLDDVIVFTKGKEMLPFPCKEAIPYLKYYLFLRSCIKRVVNVPYYLLRGFDERLCDFFCRRFIRGDATIYVFTHPVFPRTAKLLKKKGVPVVLITPNPFDIFIEEIVLEEMRKNTINGTDAYTSRFRLKDMKKYWPEIDYIISLSSVVTDTYDKYGFGNKIITLNNPLGLNFEYFENKIEKKDKVFRVCYLAHSVLLKGLQYLLEAWSNIRSVNTELIIGGSMDNNVRHIIDRKYKELKNVRYIGNVEDVKSFYSQGTIFICPSLIDAYPRTVFEAMAFGLPVIVTEGCGAKDIIDDGEEGFIIPQGNADAIREKITWFLEHPAETVTMGIKANNKIRKYPVEKFANEITEILSNL